MLHYGGSSIIRFPLVIAVSEWDMPGIEPGTLGWHNREMARTRIRVRTGTPMTHERKRDKNRDQDKNRKKDKEKD